MTILAEKVFLLLRDGRKFIGILRTIDHFGNYFILSIRLQTYCLGHIGLENTIERVFVGDKFSEKHAGLFVIRGESIELMGEVVCTLDF